MSTGTHAHARTVSDSGSAPNRCHRSKLGEGVQWREDDIFHHVQVQLYYYLKVDLVSTIPVPQDGHRSGAHVGYVVVARRTSNSGITRIALCRANSTMCAASALVYRKRPL
eukprot:COSAG05_NODE_3294_length_2172_cov_0.968644_1_plen_111_part_00